MIAGAIDLGTNTFHLIIADVSVDGVEVIYKTNLPVKLGEGRLNDNIIIPEAFERGLQALELFSKEIEKHNVAIVKATATSAIRNANNGAEFVALAKKRTGITIEVITGEEEAEYIFQGVQASEMIKGVSLIMDIGGGSTEFIICHDDVLLWKKSFDIGAARLMQAYFHSDPISNDEVKVITDHLDNVLIPLAEACAAYKPANLIGSAGAFETFAQMLSKDINIGGIKGCVLNITQYQKLAELLISSTHENRKNMPGLIALRVDMIVIAALLTNYVIDRFKMKSLSLSVYDLKIGLLHSLIVHDKASQ